MKSEFKAKFLQNLVSKKKGAEGFTLIELLVVIIIVGVLAAIALPSFLNQIGKARGSEAKANLGTINRGQQAYRLENQTFSDEVTNLDARITGNFYTYDATGGQYTTTTAADPGTNTDLKVYASGVAQSGDNTSAMVVCESATSDAAGGTAAADVDASATVAATADCSSGNVVQ
ncbi:type IV pilin protein [Altericista sp. CCNU0014]|uniref:type IV pilin protein n=1 Tax=Altericista sp. CCNU0014 TaxID=3082949 RepID=UPI00384E7397